MRVAINKTTMSISQITDLTQPQRDRLAFIELKLRFFGDVRRQDLVNRFDIQTAAATRDLAVYKQLAKSNIQYNANAKSYLLGKDFKPVFPFSTERVLAWLSLGYGDSEPIVTTANFPCEVSSRINQADMDVLAHVTRAIHKSYPLGIHYYSITSGKTERQIVPFALVDNGLRWHVRAFDRKSQEFRDFVLTRVKEPVAFINDEVLPQEMRDQDIQWNRIVELELVPHPDQPHPVITEMDYAMRNGVLPMNLRAAVAGYFLRKWSVDCSPDHSLRGHEYRLWLRNHLALYGVKNAVLAPGYRSPDGVNLVANPD
ncbi:WYL domain-containing protein [Methylomonas sp. YC3]